MNIKTNGLRTPHYKTYPVMLTFDDGEKLEVEVTVENKAYWGGQLERQIMRSFNDKATNKVVRVKVFRNSRDGGIMVDSKHGKVVEVY